jgi:site-specific recombinase XerD
MANFNRDNKTGVIYIIHWLPMNKRLQISTRIKIDNPKDWDKENQLPVNKSLKDKKGIKVVDTLARYRNAMAQAVQECEVTRSDLKQTFFTKLSGVVLRGGPMALKQVSFLEYFNNKLTVFKEDKKSNFLSYQGTYRRLIRFFGKVRPPFEQLNMQFYMDFQRFMEKENLRLNTISKQWDNVKAIISEAYVLKLHRNDDFKYFKAKQEKPVNIFLTLKELDKIHDLNLKNHPDLEKTRDSFIVAASLGLRFGDWGRVASDLIKDGDLRIQSHKTNEVAIIPCNKYVLEILAKYKGIMPKQLSNQKTNEHLKLVGKAARLNQVYEKISTIGGKRKQIPDKYKKYELITTHTARRSLATNAIISGANPYEVMKVTGHATLADFDKYIKMNEVLAGEGLKKLPMFQ